jgi:hypothetical protein
VVLKETCNLGGFARGLGLFAPGPYYAVLGHKVVDCLAPLQAFFDRLLVTWEPVRLNCRELLHFLAHARPHPSRFELVRWPALQAHESYVYVD